MIYLKCIEERFATFSPEKVNSLLKFSLSWLMVITNVSFVVTFSVLIL
nr:MAG TPA: hypothetical protein [Caudoviricetes sp.]